MSSSISSSYNQIVLPTSDIIETGEIIVNHGELELNLSHEGVSSNTNPVQTAQPSTQTTTSTTRILSGIWWMGGKVVAGMEFIGEIVANFLGLNDSQYQYVIDSMEADQYRRQLDEQRTAYENQVRVVLIKINHFSKFKMNQKKQMIMRQK